MAELIDQQINPDMGVMADAQWDGKHDGEDEAHPWHIPAPLDGVVQDVAVEHLEQQDDRQHSHADDDYARDHPVKRSQHGVVAG